MSRGLTAHGCACYFPSPSATMTPPGSRPTSRSARHGVASCTAFWPRSPSHSHSHSHFRRRLAAVPRPEPRQHHAREGRAVEGRPEAAVEEAGRRGAQFAGRRGRHCLRLLPAEGEERRRAGRVRREDRRTEVGEELRPRRSSRRSSATARGRRRRSAAARSSPSAAPASSPAGTRRPATSSGRWTRSRSSRRRTCSSASRPRRIVVGDTRWSSWSAARAPAWSPSTRRPARPRGKRPTTRPATPRRCSRTSRLVFLTGANLRGLTEKGEKLWAVPFEDRSAKQLTSLDDAARRRRPGHRQLGHRRAAIG